MKWNKAKRSEMEWNNASAWLALAKHFFFYITKLLTLTKGRENSIQFAITNYGLREGAWYEPQLWVGGNCWTLFSRCGRQLRAWNLRSAASTEWFWKSLTDSGWPGRTDTPSGGLTVRQWSKTSEQRASISSQHINTNRYISYVLWDRLTSWQTSNLT